VSRPSQLRPFSPILSNCIRDAASSSPGKISSQSTYEYAANRMSIRFPRPVIGAHLRPRNRKIKSPKSRRKSCEPCALAKCKCDLQQPCSCCVAKKKMCTFPDTRSVIAVKVIPAGASADITPTLEALTSPDLKYRVTEKHLGPEHYPLDVSSGMCLTAPSDSTIENQSWLDDAGQFVDQFNSSYLQDIFFDWSIPPGCSPLDLASTFSPIYASAETTPLGILSDPAHILTPSTYLESENARQSTGELKRYRTFLVDHVSPLLTTRSQSKSL